MPMVDDSRRTEPMYSGEPNPQDETRVNSYSRLPVAGPAGADDPTTAHPAVPPAAVEEPRHTQVLPPAGYHDAAAGHTSYLPAETYPAATTQTAAGAGYAGHSAEPVARPRVRRWPWAQLALIAALGVALVQYVAVQTDWGQTRDDDFGAFLVDLVPARLYNQAHDFVTTSFTAAFGICVLAAAIAALRRRWDLLGLAAALVLGANLTTQVLKRVVIERPDYNDLLPNSLPSGHVTLVLATGLGLALVMPRGLRFLVGLLALVWGAAMSVGTVAIGWHRPSDAIAALLVCLCWLGIVQTFRPTPPPRRSTSGR